MIKHDIPSDIQSAMTFCYFGNDSIVLCFGEIYENIEEIPNNQVIEFQKSLIHLIVL